MALEAAMLTRQDIYLLQIDFSEAFDTVNHNKLIQVLTALGFPQDAVRVVSDLYSGATTVVRTPYGDTDPIPIQRVSQLVSYTAYSVGIIVIQISGHEERKKLYL
jgi:hypothetical protein